MGKYHIHQTILKTKKEKENNDKKNRSKKQENRARKPSMNICKSKQFKSKLYFIHFKPSKSKKANIIFKITAIQKQIFVFYSQCMIFRCEYRFVWLFHRSCVVRK